MRNPFEIDELLKSWRQARGSVSKETVVNLKPATYISLEEQRKNPQNWGWLDDTVPDDYVYPEEDSTDPTNEAL